MANVRNPTKLRQKLYEQQAGKCHICGGLMIPPGTIKGNQSRKSATFDHLLPLARGGTKAQSNLKLAHKACNSYRGDKPILLSDPAHPIHAELTAPQRQCEAQK